MPDTTWKAVERQIAQRLGGRRLGATGRHGPDVLTSWLSIECKTRRRLPRWLATALHQAAVGNDGSRLPIVVLHQTGDRYDDAVVLCRLRDFCDWFGDLDAEAAA